ncbi:MAG TPA: DUF2087 domain-containing protein [Jatrophihabitans sp.]|jgi:hypothetical protein|nr:DUF2087 domain-containing protein [Jatrophihabitans sp.]
MQPASPEEVERTLRQYLRDGRLTVMPRSGRRRQIVLEHIVQLFEPGRRYLEVDVNLILRQVWDDVAALRRYLVDAALLDRSAGEYWRIGGPVDV